MARAWPIPQLRLDDPVPVALARIVRTRTRELYSHVPNVLRSSDAEAVHDLRVSARRLQAVFKVFDEWMPGKLARRIRKRLKPAVRALGAMRERHMIVHVAQRLAGDETVRRDAAVGLFIARHRHGAAMCGIETAPVLRESFSGELQEMLSECSRRLERSGAARRARAVPLAEVVGEALEPVLRRVAACAAAVNGLTRCTEELHQLRVAAKPLRYTLELLAPLCDRALRAQYEKVRAAVQQLGDVHDLDVMIAAVRTQSAELRLYNRTASEARRIPTATLDRLATDARRRRGVLTAGLAESIAWWRNETFARDILDTVC